MTIHIKLHNLFQVMIMLVDSVLPPNYFSNNLRALSVDMAVLRDLMELKLPSLASHLKRLQLQGGEGALYEPPLMNIFTMQVSRFDHRLLGC